MGIGLRGLETRDDPKSAAPGQRKEFDHIATHLHMQRNTQERGKDLQSISESIFTDEAFTRKLHDRIKQIYNETDLDSQGWASMWDKIKKEAREMCVI